MQASKYLRSFSWWPPWLDIAKHVRGFPSPGATVTPMQCRPFSSSVQSPQCESPLVGSFLKSHYDKFNSQKMSEIHQILKHINTEEYDKPAIIRENSRLFIDVKIYHDFIAYISYFPDHVLSVQEWDDFFSELKDLNKKQKTILNYRLFQYLGNLKRVDLARSFMEYLESKGEDNIVTQLQFLSVIAAKYPEIVVEEYESLKTTHYVTYVNNHVCRILTSTLCITPEWKQSIGLCESYLKYCKEGGGYAFCGPFQFIVLTALCREDLHTYAELVHKYGEFFINETFPAKVFSLWKMGIIPLDSLFEILKQASATLSKEQSLQIKRYIENVKQLNICAVSHPHWLPHKA